MEKINLNIEKINIPKKNLKLNFYSLINKLIYFLYKNILKLIILLPPLIIFYIILKQNKYRIEYDNIKKYINFREFYETKYKNIQRNKSKINNKFIKLLLNNIKEEYERKGSVNINEIESNINNGRKWEKNKNKNNEINIGAQLDSGYVLRGMMTFASIMDSQKKETKLRFHFAVVLNFKILDMLKIYSLRDKIRDDVEFNFYNAQKVEIDLKGLNVKGPGAVAKLLLPELLPDDVDRLLIFDTGDLLVLRDLTKAYSWNMNGCLYVGVPGMRTGTDAIITKEKFDVYINLGSFLVDVKLVKKEKMYEKFVKYKYAYNTSIGDQNLLNDIAFGKIGYYPFKFGLASPYDNDKDSDNPPTDNLFSFIKDIKYKEKFTFIPKDEKELINKGYSPFVIHQWNGKWMFGSGLTIYRRLAQYYIRYAGIWDEMCEIFPGYCTK